MNYLHKHNSISDVDVIRALERLDAGVLPEEILTDLPEENKEEMRSILSLLGSFAALREEIQPSRELFRRLLMREEVPAVVPTPSPRASIWTRLGATASWFRDFSDAVSAFARRRFFAPAAIAVVVLLLFIGGKGMRQEPLPLSPMNSWDVDEDTSDVATDTLVEEFSGVSPREQTISVPETGSMLQNGAEERATKNMDAPGAKALDRQRTTGSAPAPLSPAADIPLEETVSQGELSAETFDTSLLVRRELVATLPLFPEDDLSLYTEAPVDIAIDVISPE